MGRPRILLCGINKTPNQFTRALERLQCEIVHVSSNPGGPVPTDCDAAILVKCQISHDRFWTIKDKYKEVNKPVFITDFGFSPIQDRFNEFLKKFPRPAEVKITPRRATVISDAFVKAIDGSIGPVISSPTSGEPEREARRVKEVPRASKKENDDMTASMRKGKPGPKPGSTRIVNPREVTDRVNQIVRECYEAEMSTRETLEMLQAEGLKMADGREYTTAYVATIRYRLGLKPKRIKAHPKSKTTTSKAKTDNGGELDPLKLIGKVLSSNLPPERKLKVVEMIQSGKIQSESTVIAKKTSQGLTLVATNIFDLDEKPILTLNKVQAVAVTQVLEEIETFVKDSSSGV